MTLLSMKYKTKGKSIVVRTIRGRHVRINGYMFTPRDPDGISILDGKRCAFGIYWTWTGDYYREYCQMEDFVSLWGSEEMYQCIDEDSFNPAYDRWRDLTSGDDNTILWHWWDLSKVQSVAFSKRRGSAYG